MAALSKNELSELEGHRINAEIKITWTRSEAALWLGHHVGRHAWEIHAVKKWLQLQRLRVNFSQGACMPFNTLVTNETNYIEAFSTYRHAPWRLCCVFESVGAGVRCTLGPLFEVDPQNFQCYQSIDSKPESPPPSCPNYRIRFLRKDNRAASAAG